MKKLLLVLLFFVFYFFVYIVRNYSMCQKIECLRLPLLKNVKEIEVYENSHSIFRGQYGTPEGILKVERRFLSDADAKTATTAVGVQIQSLFENAQSPYPGFLSDKIICDKKYFPQIKKLINNPETMYFWGYTNNRFQYGVCSDNQIVYKTLNVVVNCQARKQWYRLELFVVKEHAKSEKYYEDLFSLISC